MEIFADLERAFYAIYHRVLSNNYAITASEVTHWIGLRVI